MKITIENFGAIKYFEFDTEKDLTLIFGKNSVGKSYAISLVYLILKKILELSEKSVRFVDVFGKEIHNDIDILEQDIKKNDSVEINISSYLEKHLVLYLEEFFINYLSDSLSNSFNDLDNLQNRLTKNKLKIKIEFSNNNLAISLGIKESNNKINIAIIECKFNKTVFLRKCETLDDKSLNNLKNIVIENDEKNIILIFPNNQEYIFRFAYLGFMSGLFERIAKDLKIINSVYYLPASRSGLYQALGAFGQIVAELSKSRSFTSKRIELPAISEPVADYFLNLANLDSCDVVNNDFIDYVDEIEREILNGKVEFDSKSKKIFFSPNKTPLKLDLSATSSMVAEISPIVSYMKYIFMVNQVEENKQNPLVFIEEPEAHLHPETQVKLMRVFARLVKDNKIKLVMTSHSNYIFNAASNLVMDNKIPIDKFEAVLFKMTEEGSIAKNMATDEYGIDDDNFIDVAESLYEEKIKIINKLNG